MMLASREGGLALVGLRRLWWVAKDLDGSKTTLVSREGPCRVRQRRRWSVAESVACRRLLAIGPGGSALVGARGP